MGAAMTQKIADAVRLSLSPSQCWMPCPHGIACMNI